jgi:hypothetical protein
MRNWPSGASHSNRPRDCCATESMQMNSDPTQTTDADQRREAEKQRWLTGWHGVIATTLYNRRRVARLDVRFTDADLLGWMVKGGELMVLDMVEDRIRKAEVGAKLEELFCAEQTIT